MTLPHTYGLVLMLTILTMLCWGSWTNVLKFTPGWRFELLYYDYSIGVALGALLVGLTFGTWGADGLGFNVEQRQIILAGGRSVRDGLSSLRARRVAIPIIRRTVLPKVNRGDPDGSHQK